MNNMKILRKDLGSEFESIQIMNIGDWHLGDASFNHKLANDTIKKIKETDNLFFTINGDMINNAIRNSVSDIYSEEMNPEEQVEKLVEMFEPIKHKLLAATSGNHCHRTYKETGIDPMKMFVKFLGFKDKDIYHPDGILLFVSFGKNKYREKVRHTVSLYLTHIGGTKARLINMADVVDADIYFRGHYHNVEIKKMDVFRTDKRYKTIRKETKTFVQNGACLKYSGYGQMKGFAPGSSVFPVAVVNVVSEGQAEYINVEVSA
jgi:predicted phosphodiesterase